MHVQGGFLVSIAREVAYQADVHAGDVVHFATDMGWIMGPWTVVGVGALGATIVFAEGAPDWPAPDRLWRTVEQERVTSLGLSPTLARALLPHGAPAADLSSLRTFVTTGEPWNPEPYRWLFEDVGSSRVPIINCTGGTEVGACFLSPTPIGPIKACSVGGPALGMAMDIVDDDGSSLVGTGEVGELVCRRPFPGMTRGFWRDPERFIETYWSRIPGVWVHGDWASVDADGFWFLHGRSDDTLNIAGKRIGPAELESAAVAHPAVREAAAIGVPHEVKGETAWIFCCLLPGAEPRTRSRLRSPHRVADELGKAFKPERIVFVDALPKTRSAKIVRRALRAKVLGSDLGDLSSVENPESLDAIEPVGGLACRRSSASATRTLGLRSGHRDGARFPREVRWPVRLAAALGGGFEVIAEGLNGRTATLDSPVADGRNGLTYLLPCLHSHVPIDLVVIYLGTNDLGDRYGLPAPDVAAAVGRLCAWSATSESGPAGERSAGTRALPAAVRAPRPGGLVRALGEKSQQGRPSLRRAGRVARAASCSTWTGSPPTAISTGSTSTPTGSGSRGRRRADCQEMLA